ncbi:hypothetical protein Cgig2_033713 [Carnegiea gigantea]|uniref:Uncharacterized protein n=1 Tax=Carnegiea gigantea TaxID=171969 RepID=A0A9Q1K7U6_9CARY|nr:hypothetical protein Cgig2_033713 [Carnegiea gigantea]
MSMVALGGVASLSNPPWISSSYPLFDINNRFKAFKLGIASHCKKSLTLFAASSSSSSAASPAVDFSPLQSGLAKKDSDAVKEALDRLSEIGWAKRWGSQPYVSRRATSLRELTSLGIKNAENLAIPSVRNDAAFLFTVVGTTGFLAVLARQLPGLPQSLPKRVLLKDWGFFLPYLIGSISLVVLAVGSISPGLLQAAISGFSSVFPDYQERIARHEAAHFLVAYLLGLPILDYSLDIGKEHVNLINDKLEKLIYSGQLDAKDLDRLAVVSMAGLAAEGLTYDKVIGQSADLFTLQRFINRSKPQLTKEQQQNLTRWAVSFQESGFSSCVASVNILDIYTSLTARFLKVMFAASLVKNNKAVHEALMAAMSQKATVLECIQTIEMAS